MTERMNLNMEDLEMVNGGTDDETFQLALILFLTGHGNHLCYNGSYMDADTDKIANTFESRGWNFIPSKDGKNLYVDNNGLRFDQIKVLDIIENNKF